MSSQRSVPSATPPRTAAHGAPTPGQPPSMGGGLTLLVIFSAIGALLPIVLLVEDLLDISKRGILSGFGQGISSGRMSKVEASIGTDIFLIIATSTIALLCFALWASRGADNLRRLRVAQHGLTSIGVMGGFLIPILHWIYPQRVLSVLWKTSDKNLPPSDLGAWRRATSSFAIFLWWLCWMLYSISAVVFFGLALQQTGATNVPAAATLLLRAGLAAGMFWLMLNILVALRVDQRQRDRWDVVRDFERQRQQPPSPARPPAVMAPPPAAPAAPTGWVPPPESPPTGG